MMEMEGCMYGDDKVHLCENFQPAHETKKIIHYVHLIKPFSNVCCFPSSMFPPRGAIQYKVGGRLFLPLLYKSVYMVFIIESHRVQMFSIY